MVFCNKNTGVYTRCYACHNPYFNRWFSAITILSSTKTNDKRSHNPYFNRWFSAIEEIQEDISQAITVTILILIDGFLQSTAQALYNKNLKKSQSLF